MVWFDSRDGDMEIYYKESLDEGLTWQPDTRLTRRRGVSDGRADMPGAVVKRTSGPQVTPPSIER